MAGIEKKTETKRIFFKHGEGSYCLYRLRMKMETTCLSSAPTSKSIEESLEKEKPDTER